MIHKRKVQASQSHSADWYDCTYQELIDAFGAPTIKRLVSEIGNGKESVNNQSEQVSRQSDMSCCITLNTNYRDWVNEGKPLNRLSYEFINLRSTL